MRIHFTAFTYIFLAAQLSSLTGCNQNVKELVDASEGSFASVSLPAADGEVKSAVELGGEQTNQENQALQPILVGGSFLTCAVDGMANDQSTLVVECSVSLIEALATASDQLDFGFSARLPDGTSELVKPLQVEVRVSVPDGKAKWRFKFDRKGLGSRNLLVRVSDKRLQTGLKVEINLELKTYQGLTLVNKPSKIGDRTSGRSCIQDTEFADYSPQQRWPFAISEDQTKIEISLKGLCGLNARADSPSTLKIFNGKGEEVFTIDLTPNQEELKLSEVRLPLKGQYHIELRSGLDNGNADDFYFRNLSIFPVQGAL